MPCAWQRCLNRCHTTAKGCGRAAVTDADEQAARQTLEHEAVRLAVLAHGRHVHDGQQLLDVLRQYVVEQALVAVLGLWSMLCGSKGP